MFKYGIKRLLIFIPTLIVISLVAFWLSTITPGDPVMRFVEEADGMSQRGGGVSNFDREYKRAAQMLKMDKPVFYVKFTSAAYPDSLYRIVNRDRRHTIEKLIAQYGNWTEVKNWLDTINRIDQQLIEIPDSIIASDIRNRMRGIVHQLYFHHRHERITFELNQLDTLAAGDEQLAAYLDKPFTQLQHTYGQLREQPSRYRLYIPVIYWYGFDNQYHHWLSAFLQGDFGHSYQDNRPVAAKMYDAAFWTILLNILSILIAYFIAVPLGVIAAIRRGQLFDRLSSLVLFMLFSLPSFWIATMLVVFFTTPEYGSWANIFPSIGLGECYTDTTSWECFWIRAAHLILPVACLSYGGLAFISRQMRGAMLDVVGQDFIRTARAKGLSERRVMWKHAFRNSLFPVITLVALVFPATISGSVVIEVIFNIPGMGRLVYDAMFARDWPVVFTVMILTAGLTMTGNLVADFLYAAADPRVSYSKQS